MVIFKTPPGSFPWLTNIVNRSLDIRYKKYSTSVISQHLGVNQVYFLNKSLVRK